MRAANRDSHHSHLHTRELHASILVRALEILRVVQNYRARSCSPTRCKSTELEAELRCELCEERRNVARKAECLRLMPTLTTTLTSDLFLFFLSFS